MLQEHVIRDPEYKVGLNMYNIQAFVYILPNGLATEYSNKIHYLDKFKIMTISVNRAYELALLYLDKQYPWYKGYFYFQ